MTDWQVVCDESDGRCTSRLAVPGGWLYRFESLVPVSEASCQSNVALAFVPKPKLSAKVRRKTC
jgi:hypothetical protein